MTVQLKKSVSARATPITVVDRAGLGQLLTTLPIATRQWLQTTGFTAAPDRETSRGSAHSWRHVEICAIVHAV